MILSPEQEFRSRTKELLQEKTDYSDGFPEACWQMSYNPDSMM